MASNNNSNPNHGQPNQPFGGQGLDSSPLSGISTGQQGSKPVGTAQVNNSIQDFSHFQTQNANANFQQLGMQQNPGIPHFGSIQFNGASFGDLNHLPQTNTGAQPAQGATFQQQSQPQPTQPGMTQMNQALGKPQIPIQAQGQTGQLMRQQLTQAQHAQARAHILQAQVRAAQAAQFNQSGAQPQFLTSKGTPLHPGAFPAQMLGLQQLQQLQQLGVTGGASTRTAPKIELGTQPEQIQPIPVDFSQNSSGRFAGMSMGLNIPGSINSQAQVQLLNLGGGAALNPTPLPSIYMGGWQTESDLDDRRQMIHEIIQLLQFKRPDAPQEWLRKLPYMARRLEESLYRTATSRDEYNNHATLKQRLQSLALSMGAKANVRAGPLGPMPHMMVGGPGNPSGMGPVLIGGGGSTPGLHPLGLGLEGTDALGGSSVSGGNSTSNVPPQLQALQSLPKDPPSTSAGQHPNSQLQTPQPQQSLPSNFDAQMAEINRSGSLGEINSMLDSPLDNSPGLGGSASGGGTGASTSAVPMAANQGQAQQSTGLNSFPQNNTKSPPLQSQASLSVNGGSSSAPQITPFQLSSVTPTGGAPVVPGSASNPILNQFNLQQLQQQLQRQSGGAPINLQQFLQSQSGQQMLNQGVAPFSGGAEPIFPSQHMPGVLPGLATGNDQQFTDPQMMFPGAPGTHPFLNLGGHGGFPISSGGGSNLVMGQDPNYPAARQYTPEERKQVLRQQQQRLLLLRHASKCRHEDGKCPVTPHCAGMKKLWKHIAECKDQKCQVPHCVSSRYVLSHYHRCKDPCAVCGPVRAAIQQNTEKAKQFMAKQMQDTMAAMPFSADSDPSLGRTNQVLAFNPGHIDPQPGAANPMLLAVANGQLPGQHMLPSSHQMLQHQLLQMQQHAQQQQQASQSGGPSLQQQQNLFQQLKAGGGPALASLQAGMTGAVLGAPVSDNAGVGHSAPSANLTQSTVSLLSGFPGSGAAAASQIGSPQVAPGQLSVGYNQLTMFGGVQNLSVGLQNLQQAPQLPNQPSPGNLLQQPQQQPAQGLKITTVLQSPQTAGINQQPAAPQQHQIHFKPPGGKSAVIHAKKRACYARKAIKDEPSPIKEEPPPEGSLIKKFKTEALVETDVSMQECSLPEVPRGPLRKPPIHQSSPEISRGQDDKAENVSPGARTCSLLDTLLSSNIEAHLKELQSGYRLNDPELKKKCQSLLKTLMDNDFGWIFNTPVDPIELNLPDYFNVIKNPMDLGTVKQKLDSGQYPTVDAFANDCSLTFDNAISYNEDGSDVNQIAREMKHLFEDEREKMLKAIRDDEEARKMIGDACCLCGHEDENYEPAVIYCNGNWCSFSKIRRNSYYYAYNKFFNWCSHCYSYLSDDEPIANTVDCAVMKNDLQKSKNDEIIKEPWISCTLCNRAVHQICALYNKRLESCNNPPPAMSNPIKGSSPIRSTSQSSLPPYHCPNCVLSQRRKMNSSYPASDLVLGAKLLPETKLSEFLEMRVNIKLKEYAEQIETEMSCVPVLWIRQVSNIDLPQPVKEHMYQRYKDRGYPAEFSFRSKCILLFQTIDGVDVMLFGMYVYEYGHQCPSPNRRRVYISYLDSVNFLRPRIFRTKVYHEILIGYLDFVKRRGFHTAHIWACPPLKGDDYIIYCHPEDQKTPKDDRLKKWYVDMLHDAQNEGIVHSLTNLYDEFFDMPSPQILDLPYLEGDYWTGEVENIIKELDGGCSEGLGSSRSKRAGKQNPTNIEPQSQIAQDSVMSKLGKCIKPMKESFIVARLQSPEDAKEMDQKLEDETQDQDCDMSSDSFDTRQSFLNLCQANHYQFDKLRRGKHSSTMVLFHLHHPEAPRSLDTCSNCDNEIYKGYQNVCKLCKEYILCEECYSKMGHQHPHIMPRKRVDLDQMSEQQRKEQQQNIKKLHEGLLHAASCKVQACTPNCEKIKDLLKHAFQASNCTDNCPKCQMWKTLVHLHARRCQSTICQLPDCQSTREQYSMKRQQQNMMDERRRAQMNQMYAIRRSVSDSS